MPESDFERYKAALKAGHVALLRERLPEALERYTEAAAIAPDRPLPHASRGRVLLRLGRTEEALAAYARALGRAPRDEASLAGRAEALLTVGRQREAAEVLERLAEVQVETDRLPEGLATMRRALALHSTKRRTRRVGQLEAKVPAPSRAEEPEPEPEPVAEARPEDIAPGPEAEPGPHAVEAEPPPGPGAEPDPHAVEAEPAPWPAADTLPAPAAERAALAPEPAAPTPEPELAAPDPSQGVRLVEGGPDPAELEARAELAMAYGRRGEAVDTYLAAARAYAGRGAPDAALEACRSALALSPAAAAVHLAFVRQYLDRGWRDLAAQKVGLLARLAELDPSTLSSEGWTALDALRTETGAAPQRPSAPTGPAGPA